MVVQLRGLEPEPPQEVWPKVGALNVCPARTLETTT